jgi:hypothetical protein
VVQKVSVLLEDDLTGGPAERTIRFAFEGTDYEIDLNAKNAAKFCKQLAPYLEHARRAGRAQARRAGRTGASRQRSGDIRAWANEHGLAVSERGRIPARVVEQYNAAPYDFTDDAHLPGLAQKLRASKDVVAASVPF